MMWILLLARAYSFNVTGGSIEGYYTIEEIESYLLSLSQSDTSVEYSDIGFTLLDASIPSLRLLRPGAAKVLIVGGHHARELISVTQVLFLLDTFLNPPTEAIRELRNSLEFLFIPVLNVDTYKYIAEEFNRTSIILPLRKNARSSDECSRKESGVDLNRNYGFKWGIDNDGSSNQQCSEDYRGDSAFSEPETQALQNVLSEQFALAVSYHSFGNLYVHPYSYLNSNDHSKLRPGDYEIYKKIGKHICQHCKMGNAYQMVGYPVNGNFIDYAYSIGTFSLAVELGNSFHPFSSEIQQSLDQHLDPFVYLVSLVPPKFDSFFYTELAKDKVKVCVHAENYQLSTGLASIELKSNSNFTVENFKGNLIFEKTVFENEIKIYRNISRYEKFDVSFDLQPSDLEFKMVLNNLEVPQLVIDSFPYEDQSVDLFVQIGIFIGILTILATVYCCYRYSNNRKYRALSDRNSSVEIYYT